MILHDEHDFICLLFFEFKVGTVNKSRKESKNFVIC